MTAERAIVPPHSDEAEHAVIGSLLLDNGCLDLIDGLEAKHFYHPEHGRAFAQIVPLIVAGKAADVLTVAEAGGGAMAYLHEMAQSVPSASHVHEYAEIVRERWVERELIKLSGQTIDDALAMGGAAEKLDRAMTRLTTLAQGKATSESVLVEDAVVAFLDRITAEAEGKTQVISTGLHDLDRQLAGGGRRGELFVVGARPKMGKTALTLQMGRNIARAHGVLMCSMEMPLYELTSRNVAALGNINLAHMRSPDRMPDAAWSGMSEAVEQMRGLKLMLDDQPALKLLDVRRKVMNAKRRMGCEVVIIDYLQLMSGDGDNRNQELDRISNGLKAMAKEFDVWVILLSQLSREADKRHGPPVMTDLRDSGAIEAAADVIGMLYREFAHPLGERGEMWKHHAQLELVQRNGAPGTVDLWFSGEYQQYRDWSGPPPSRMSSKGGRARSNGVD